MNWNWNWTESFETHLARLITKYNKALSWKHSSNSMFTQILHNRILFWANVLCSRKTKTCSVSVSVSFVLQTVFGSFVTFLFCQFTFCLVDLQFKQGFSSSLQDGAFCVAVFVVYCLHNHFLFKNTINCCND